MARRETVVLTNMCMVYDHQGNILIDAAGSENKDLANDVIIPVLQAKGITSLDLVIITHDDLDHNGSLSSIQQQISIKRIITEKQQKELILKGGRGGKGNSHFATSTRQAPRFAQGGEKGIEKEVILELKLLADVGLIGFPSVR